ncbi:GNAT family N-acetyltransferase [Roseimarinus sediminis]|uniref:GNAT family N-acetyltransferase n=1 Tax=Roseimarinus sediminis TaxID=1610899 RepID=UPI003D225CBD
MQVIIKSFSELSNAEIYEILKLRSEIFVVEQQCIYNDLDDLDQEALHLYCSENGDIIAYVRLLKPGTRFPVASIGRVLTKMNHRRKGLSTLLMQKGIAFLQNEWSAATIKISAQKYLRKFYEDLGFKVVSKAYLEDGIPHYEMELGAR